MVDLQAGLDDGDILCHLQLVMPFLTAFGRDNDTICAAGKRLITEVI